MMTSRGIRLWGDPTMQRTATWVDRALSETGIRLTDLERRQLMAALISRPHLVLSGPGGIGKSRLAQSLARCITDERPGHVCTLQDHPWWAAGTGDVAYFTHLQTVFSAWRLAHFMESVPHDAHGTEAYVICVERISLAEIDCYFEMLLLWLAREARSETNSVPLRLIGTYDSNTPPDLDPRVRRMAALVHLGGSDAPATDGNALKYAGIASG